MTEKKKRPNKILISFILAFLLICSFSLIATGAYFTATDSKTISTTIKFGKVAVTMSVNELQVKRNNGDWEIATNDMIVMPGDRYKGGSFTATITTTDKSGVYYVIKDNDGNYKKVVDGALVDAGTTLTPVAIPAKNGDTGTLILNFGGPTSEDGEFIGNDSGANITNNSQNQVLSLGLIGTFTIKVIQASNITPSEALTELTK